MHIVTAKVREFEFYEFKKINVFFCYFHSASYSKSLNDYCAKISICKPIYYSSPYFSALSLLMAIQKSHSYHR